MKRIFRATAFAVTLLVGSSSVIANQRDALPSRTNDATHKTALEKLNLAARSNWVVSLGAGAEFPILHSNTVVDNGSNFAAPYNQDSFSLRRKSGATVQLALAYRVKRDTPWFSALSAGLSYQNIASTNAGGNIMQYTQPDFTNYDFNNYISSNVLLAFTKINLFRYQIMSPYIKAGLGCAFNRSSNYNENALSGVTPRVSPAFSSKTTSQFAYQAGAGIDFQISPQWILSAGYEYLHLGNVSSGRGKGLWASQSLNLSSYQTNQAFMSLSYLLGKR